MSEEKNKDLKCKNCEGSEYKIVYTEKNAGVFCNTCDTWQRWVKVKTVEFLKRCVNL